MTGSARTSPMPAELASKAAEARKAMIELAIEGDDAVTEAYLNGDEPDENTLKRCIRQGTIARAFVPVLCGSAFKNKGVQTLLDAVVDFLPSPQDIPARDGIAQVSDDQPFVGLAFKVMNDPVAGTLTFVRIYSGDVASGAEVLNATREKNERVGRMLQMHANSREEIKCAF